MNKHHGWAKGQPGEATVNNTNNYNIKQINVLSSKSKEDLVKLINIQLKSLDMLPADIVPAVIEPQAVEGQFAIIEDLNNGS